MDSILEIFSFHAEGERNGNPLSCARMPLDVWRECAEKLPKLILGSSFHGDLRIKMEEALTVSSEEGSIKFVFRMIQSLWLILNAAGFGADFAAISRGDIINVKDPRRTRILMELGESLKKSGAQKIGLASNAASIAEFDLLESRIGEKVENAAILDSESYVVAEIEDLGGARKVNIHLRVLPTGEKIVAQTSREFLSSLLENVLYKTVIAHVRYKVNAITKEKYDYCLVEFSPPALDFNVEEFEKSLENYHTDWEDFSDPVLEVRRLRGADV